MSMRETVYGILATPTTSGPFRSMLGLEDSAVRECTRDQLENGRRPESFSAIIASLDFIGEKKLFQSLSNIVPVIIVDEDPSYEKAVLAIRNGAYDYLTAEPQDHLQNRIVESVQSFHDASDRYDLEQKIIGNCLQVVELRSMISKVAPIESPVLIYGPTGAGTTLIASCLHAASSRSDRPLVTLNCDLVPDDLVMSELFGSSDDDSIPGRIAAAARGTLFLREVGALPLEAQAGLLHLFKYGEIQRQPANQFQSVDTRIVVSSSTSLDQLAAQSKFRDDLRIWLSQYTLNLPPLAERESDIHLLAQTMLEKHCANLKKPGLQFSPAAVERMNSYHWPGNVRELDQAVERSVLLCDENWIMADHLGLDSVSPPDRENETKSGDYTTLSDYFVEFVRTNEEKFTETELAEKLGISRKSLWERRNKLGIPRRRTKIKRLHS